MSRRPSGRTIRKHRNYTVDEAARALRVAKVTVRRWLKAGLPAVTERRPTLIVGGDLIAFLASTRPKKHSCAIHQAYCFSCRAPRGPALGEVEISTLRGTTAHLFAMCEVCGTGMYKAVSLAQIIQLKAHATVSIGPGVERIGEHRHPLLNDDFN